MARRRSELKTTIYWDEDAWAVLQQMPGRSLSDKANALAKRHDVLNRLVERAAERLEARISETLAKLPGGGAHGGSAAVDSGETGKKIDALASGVLALLRDVRELRDGLNALAKSQPRGGPGVPRELMVMIAEIHEGLRLLLKLGPAPLIQDDYQRSLAYKHSDAMLQTRDDLKSRNPGSKNRNVKK